MSDAYWIGVDLGGTKILAGLFDNQLNLIARSKLSTNSEQGGPAVLQRVIQAINQAAQNAKIPLQKVSGLGLAVPGQIVPKSSIVRFAPNLDWRDFDLKPNFPTEWNFPVIVENDVRMGTYGEWTRGAAQGSANVFGIFAGTGVGGGLILNGQLFHGFNGHAGEIGHIVIDWRKEHSLEDIAGRRNLMKRLKKTIDKAPRRVKRDYKGLDPTNFKSSQIAELFQKGDPPMVQAVDRAACAIGSAIASVVNLLSPEVIVIGGGMAQSLGEQWTERIWEVANRFILPGAAENVRCSTAALGDDAGITGAAAYARNTFGAKL